MFHFIQLKNLDGEVLYTYRHSVLDHSPVLLSCALQEASRKKVILQRADLRGVNLMSVNLDGLCAPESDWSGSVLERVSLQGAVLTSGRFDGTTLREVDLSDSNLDGATWSAASETYVRR